MNKTPILKKITVGITLLLCFSLFQDTGAQSIICGDGILKSYLDRNYPEYMESVQHTFEEAKSKGANPFRSQEVYTIPIVVHVVWKEEEENLHDSIIHNQIQTLNEDFRRLNLDALNIRSIFASRVGDPGIEFELVGIERVKTEEEFTPSILGLPDQVKKSIDGGSDAWNTEEYLNLWVCNIQPLSIFGIEAVVLGYAYPPANLSHWPEGAEAPSPEVDGVVVDYRIFGRNNSLKVDPGTGDSISGYGRTAVHEIGHYLGLRHLWGDVLFGDGCSEDDGVEDTPNQASSSNWECDTTKNTCEISPVNYPDMIENYMDYSAETCMNSFTMGQIQIMRAVLEGPRAGLIEGTVSVEDSELVDGISLQLYPNPTSDGVFYLSLSDITEPIKLGYQLFDNMGRLVKSRENLDELETIDISNQSPGMYHLRLIDRQTSREIAARKLILTSH